MDFIKRNIEHIIKYTLSDTPVTVIQGARQVGKSTLAAMISKDFKCRSVTLDLNTTLNAAKENPYEFVSQYKDDLFIIDEIQRCPELITAIKLAVDNDRRPGRFLITGSANILNLRGANESLAGRAETIVLMPFSNGELIGIKEDFVSLLTGDSILDKLYETTSLTRAQYAGLVEKGGYPEVQSRTAKRKKAYFKNYISRVLDHDAVELSGLAHLDRLNKLFTLLAGNPSQIYIRSNVSRLMGIPESSMNGYIRLLEDLCLLNSIPAWGKNYSKRAINRPKIVLSDTGLISSLNGLSSDFLSNIENGNEFGPLLETFTIAEILKQQTWSETDYKVFHYRDSDNKEADLVLELDNGKIIAIEIKAASSFSRSDFSGLKTLRDMLGNRFHCGVLLYTGTEILPFGDKLYVSPISSIWNGNA